MAQTINQLKTVEILGHDRLVNELRLNKGIGRAICIIGEAGVSKTHSVEEFAITEKFDKYFEVKLAGCSSEDMTGIPIKNRCPETGKEIMEFAPLGWMQYIINHPEQKILLFLDEIGRADASIQSSLFDLMTSKIKGKYYPNLQVVMAMNYGVNYESTFSFEDDAFIRRCIFFKYSPLKKDVETFFKKMKYQKYLQELLQQKGVAFLDYGLKDEDGYEFEQTTNLGSWYSFNQRLKNKAEIIGKELDELTLAEVISEFTLCAKLFFNERMSIKIKTAFQEMMNVDVDIEKDVLAKGSIPKAFQSKSEDVLLKLKSFIISEPVKILDDHKNKGNYIDNILKIYNKKGEYIVQTIQELNQLEGENKAAGKSLGTTILMKCPMEIVEQLTALVDQ